MSTAKKKTIDEIREVSLAGMRRGKSRHADKRLELPLSGVRTSVGKTQKDLAQESGIDQGDISRLERKDVDDMEVGTLRKYLAAMGVTLELVAVAGVARITIRSPDK